MILLKEAYLAYQNSARYIKKHSESDDTKIQVSKFWKGFLDQRVNWPSFSEMIRFRSSKFAYGLGTQKDVEYEKERERFKKYETIVLEDTPEEYVFGLSEPALGGPSCHPIGEAYMSPSFLMNAGTSYRVVSALEGKAKEKINYCEIGPGWGCVTYQLLSVLNLNKVLVCDIPDNLFLSSYFLQSAFPTRNFNWLEMDKTRFPDNSVTFSLPQFIDQVSEKFDVVLNSFSLQEMDKDTALAYVSWVNDRLSDDGVFVSINSHGKAGISKGSEYNYSRFNLVSFKPFRRVQASIYNSVAYEMILSKKTDNSPTFNEHHFDAITYLIQFGFTDAISELIEKFTADNLSESEKVFLESIKQIQDEREADKMLEIISNSEGEQFNLFLNVLKCLVTFSKGKLDDYVKLSSEFIESQSFKSDQSRDYYKSLLLICESFTVSDRANELGSIKEAFEQLSPALYIEFCELLVKNDVSQFQHYLGKRLELDMSDAYYANSGKSSKNTGMLKRLFK
jgi:putative sugar O-methyltransferase